MLFRDGVSEGLRKANNAGLVTTTAGPDLCHTMPTLPTPRTARIVKILVWSAVGNVQLIFGTLDQAAVPGWVPLMPTLLALNGVDSVWLEEEIPIVEFMLDTSAGVLGMTGDIWVQADQVGALLRLEVEEFGA